MQRSHRLVLLLSIVVAWAAWPSAAQAAIWTPGPTFGQGTLVGFGGAAIDGTGVSTVSWAQDTGDGPTVYAQRIGPDGARGPELRVGRGNESTVAATASGAVVAWTDLTGAVKVARVSPGVVVDSPVNVAAGGAPTTPLFVAARPNGDLVVAWMTPVDLDQDGEDDDDRAQLQVRRIAADQTKGPVVDLGLATYGMSLSKPVTVAITADGRARVAWTWTNAARTANEVRVARLTGTGALDAVGAVSGSPLSAFPELAASGDGAIVTWWEFDESGPGLARLKAARLPAAGPVARAPTTIGSGIGSAGFPTTAVALAPDGTATIAYPRDSSTLAQSTSVFLRRLLPDDTATPETLLSEAPKAKVASGMPSLAPTTGGQLIAVWLRAATTGDGAFTVTLSGRTIAADGTPIGSQVDLPGSDDVFAVPPAAIGDGAGNGMVLWVAGGGVSPIRYATALFDAVAPTATATIPASVERGVEASFSVVAAARAGVSGVTWDFGDGDTSLGTSVTHTFGRTGSYRVAVTVTDLGGNQTVVARTVTVTDPVVVPPPGGGTTPPGGGGGTTPPGGGTTPPPVARVSARLKVTKASRTTSRVSLAGTVDPRASGRVTLTWSQKVGRRTVKRSASAKIAKGRFSGAVKLTKAMSKARTAGRLVVSYAGDADTLAASASRTVKAPKTTKKR